MGFNFSINLLLAQTAHGMRRWDFELLCLEQVLQRRFSCRPWA